MGTSQWEWRAEWERCRGDAGQPQNAPHAHWDDNRSQRKASLMQPQAFLHAACFLPHPQAGEPPQELQGSGGPAGSTVLQLLWSHRCAWSCPAMGAGHEHSRRSQKMQKPLVPHPHPIPIPIPSCSSILRTQPQEPCFSRIHPPSAAPGSAAAVSHMHAQTIARDR